MGGNNLAAQYPPSIQSRIETVCLSDSDGGGEDGDEPLVIQPSPESRNGRSLGDLLKICLFHQFIFLVKMEQPSQDQASSNAIEAVVEEPREASESLNLNDTICSTSTFKRENLLNDTLQPPRLDREASSKAANQNVLASDFGRSLGLNLSPLGSTLEEIVVGTNAIRPQSGGRVLRLEQNASPITPLLTNNPYRGKSNAPSDPRQKGQQEVAIFYQ